jgi:hypothetical protein
MYLGGNPNFNEQTGGLRSKADALRNKADALRNAAAARKAPGKPMAPVASNKYQQKQAQVTASAGNLRKKAADDGFSQPTIGNPRLNAIKKQMGVI